MPKLKWNNFAGGLWLAGPGETNPPTTLRRAKGVYPLRTQAIRSRSGTLQYFVSNAISMTRFDDEYILATAYDLRKSVSLAINSEIVISGSSELNGAQLAFVQMPPTALAQTTASTISDFLFIAGGGELRKLSPSNATSSWTLTEWGIAPPDISSMTATAVAEGNANRKVIHACDATTSWVATTEDGTWDHAGGDFLLDTTRKVESTGSLRMRAIAKDSDVHIEYPFSPDLNLKLFDDGTTASADEDYITFALRVGRPKHIKNIEIAFDVANGGTPFTANYYSREFKVKQVSKRKRRELRGTGDLIRRRDEQKFLEDKKSLDRDLSMHEWISEDTVAVVRRRWTKITIPKSSFKKSGTAGASGTDWATVQALRFSIETNKKGKGIVNIDDIKMIGGTGTQGDYSYNITYLNSETGTRSNPDLTNTVRVQDIQRVAISLDDIPLSTDGQVDKIEIWRTLGNGELFFKAKEIDNTEDAPDSGKQSTTDNVADYIGMFEGATNILEDIELPIDNIKPEDTYEDCAGPHYGRMWWSRDSAPGKGGRVYYSPVGRAEAVAGFIDVSGNDDAVQKLAIWNNILYAITISHIYQIMNTDEPFVAHEVLGAPGTEYPHSVAVSPMGIIYRATDGVRIFPGNTGFSSLLGSGDPLAPVFRKSTTDGFSVAFNGDQGTYGRGEYYISDSTSASSTTLACDVTTGAWRNLGHPFKFLYFDAEGNRLFGAPKLATIGGAWFTRANNATGTFLVQNTSQYVSIGSAIGTPTGSATIAQRQMLCPKAITLKSIYVKLDTALGAGETVTCNININGTADTTFTVTLAQSDGTNAVGATGSIAIAQDDLICYEFGFTGGTSATVNSISASYTIAPE